MASLSLLGVHAVSGHHGIGLGSSRQLILNIAGLRNSESHLSVGLLAGNVECGRQLGRGEPWMTYIGLRAAGVSDKLRDAHTWGCCCSCRKSSGQAVSLSTPGDGDFLSDTDLETSVSHVQRCRCYQDLPCDQHAQSLLGRVQTPDTLRKLAIFACLLTPQEDWLYWPPCFVDERRELGDEQMSLGSGGSRNYALVYGT